MITTSNNFPIRSLVSELASEIHRQQSKVPINFIHAFVLSEMQNLLERGRSDSRSRFSVLRDALEWFNTGESLVPYDLEDERTEAYPLWLTRPDESVWTAPGPPGLHYTFAMDEKELNTPFRLVRGSSQDWHLLENNQYLLTPSGKATWRRDRMRTVYLEPFRFTTENLALLQHQRLAELKSEMFARHRRGVLLSIADCLGKANECDSGVQTSASPLNWPPNWPLNGSALIH